MTKRVIEMRLEDIQKRLRHEDWFVAQFGEDRLLAKMFQGKIGFCVEVGANDGIDGSNTFYLEKTGWQGILVEADPDLIDKCRRARPRSEVVHAAAVPPGTPATVSFEVVEGHSQHSALSLDDLHRSRTVMFTGDCRTRLVTVPARTLDDILTQLDAPPGLELITIDVEGHEWGVLQGLSLDRWMPGIIMVERNTYEPDERISNHMKQHGYRYLCTTPTWDPTGNDWYVPIAGPYRKGLPDKWKTLAAIHPRLQTHVE